MNRILLLLIAITLSQVAWAQNPFRGDVLEYSEIGGKKIRKIYGNVVFEQPDKVLTADTAIEFVGENTLKFIGRVKLVQRPEGSTIEGDTLYFDKASKFARIVGNVRLTDNNTVVSTSVMNYNTATGLAYYTVGGTINDGKNVLTSEYGEYNKDKRTLYFTKNVKLKGDDGSLDTDTLRYFTQSKVARFYGATTITNKDGTVKSTSGEYNTETKAVKFFKRSAIDNPDYYLEGDKVDFVRGANNGYAKGNVLIISKKDSITIQGDEARFDDEKGTSMVWGRAVAKLLIQRDSLFITADTLLTLNNRIDTARMLKAFHHVKVFKGDLQAISDSLVYKATDSSIYFFKDPVLWNAAQQITGDTVRIQLANKKLDKVYVLNNAFLVQQDTIKNFNQIKGRDVTSYFRKGKINQIDVNGNAQNIYFALEKDTVLQGMNKVIAANISVKFDSLNKVSTISFLKQPEALFIPPHEIVPSETKLKGFAWRITERPTYDSIYLVRNTIILKDEATIGTKNVSNKKGKRKATTQKPNKPIKKSGLKPKK